MTYSILQGYKLGTKTILNTVEKMQFFIKNFLSKCDQMWPDLVTFTEEKYLRENFKGDRKKFSNI